MNYEKGLVSVIIPTYKRAETLVKAIDSVLGQTYRNIELLVVNDNTVGDEYSQELYRIMDSYDDKRLKLIEQEKHINGAAARNAGIRNAVGEYIAFQDDDDYWEPQKIELQVELLSTLDDSFGAVSCLMRIYRNDELLSSTLPYRDGEILIDILTRKVSMGTGSLLIRRTALDNAGYFDEGLIRHQDLQLFARLTSKYKVKLLKRHLHNREVKDVQNRPDAEKLLNIKKMYFASIEDIMQSLPKRIQKRIYIMHDFEVAFAFLKKKQKSTAIKLGGRVFRSPVTVMLAIERSARRILETRLRFHIEKKYRVKD